MVLIFQLHIKIFLIWNFTIGLFCTQLVCNDYSWLKGEYLKQQYIKWALMQP